MQGITPTGTSIQQIGAAITVLIAHLGLQIGDEHIRSTLLRFIICEDPVSTKGTDTRLSVYDALNCDPEGRRHLFIELTPSHWIRTASWILVPHARESDVRPLDAPEMIARWALIIEASKRATGRVEVHVRDYTKEHKHRMIVVESGQVTAPEGSAATDPESLKKLEHILSRLTKRLTPASEGSA